MPVSVVNAWKGTFSQPAAFGTAPPALQSTVIALNVANSLGTGSGTATAGNWLAVVTGMNQPSAASGFTVGVQDDTRAFWRPGDVSRSLWAVSAASALSRASFWYTANTQRAVQTVYVAPNGAFDASTVIVLEISGLGPWDVITGISAAYAAAATTLNLSLPAPSAASAVIAAVAGDTTAVTQTFAPAGWTTVPQVSATNGTDHTCDSVLNAAYLPSTTGSVSVSATTSAASDLAGVIIGFQISAPSPIGAGVNPAWPGRTTLEAAFGSGMNTPPDQMTWTVLSDSAWTRAQGYKRYWGYSDKSGIPYALGQLQSSSGAVMLNNWDAALSPWNAGSPYYSTALNSNMSFQSGVAPWTGYDGATLSRSSAFSYASAKQGRPAYSLLITPNGTTAAPGAGSELVPVTASTQYTASGWAYCPGGWASGFTAGINWYNSSGTFLSSSFGTTAALGAATWTQYTATAVSPATAAYAQTLLQTAGTPSAGTLFYCAEGAIVPGSAAVQTGRVTTGVPVRVRTALGTIGGTTYNRWHNWQRFALDWPEKRNKSLRNYVELSTTDLWSAMSAQPPSPYRAEVTQDQPYADYPCDDEPTAGGVQPATLRNAAPGNTTPLSITPSPNGVNLQDCWGGANPTDLSALFPNFANTPVPGVAVYQCGQDAGWLYGDPANSGSSLSAEGGQVTASPGSAAWQHSGCLGNTGAHGWFLAANDTGYPDAGTATGCTVEIWCQYPFFFGPAAFQGPTGSGQYGGNIYNVCLQPYAPMTLLEMATATSPVATLQLDVHGHLTLSLNGGAAGTIYNSSDLRCGAWFCVTLTFSSAGHAYYINGGLTASGSSVSAPSPSNWTWLTANGDLGSGGGSTLSGIQHSGNVSVGRITVFPSVLPAWRIRSRYTAAITGFGVLPAPTGLQLQQVGNKSANAGFVPDGSAFNGLYGWTSATVINNFVFSAVAAAVAGSYTSGPSARQTIGGRGVQANPAVGQAVWMQCQSLAPLTQYYTAASANAETEAAAVLGSGDAFTAGYGSGATGTGVSQVSAGTGASPPTAPSALGDTVAQRIERIMGNAGITAPMRAIDATASLLVQAANDTGGQQAGASIQNVVTSDSGFMATDTNGTLFYKSRTHLAADTALWNIGNTGQVTFLGDVTYSSDPQRVFNVIKVTPYSPDGASLPAVTPSSAALVTASQAQYGTRPYPVTSYLQSQAAMQSMANWLIAQFGQISRRIKTLTIEAASQPAAWGIVESLNPGDLITVYDAPIGQPATTGTYRVSLTDRAVSYGANGLPVTARITFAADPVPSSYWS